jgi:hypothetical protein
MTWPKVCPCCGERYSREQWLQLRYGGFQPGIDEIPNAELRHCPCRNTLAVPLVDGWLLTEDGGLYDHETDTRDPQERLAS